MEKKLIGIAEYMDIILNLLYPPYNINSIVKIIFISFLVKFENERITDSFKSRKNDIIETFMKNNAFKVNTDFNDFKNILECINILSESSIIEIKEDEIFLLKKNKNINCQNDFLCKYKKYANEKNPILELNKLSSQALIEEVLAYV